MVSGAIFKYFPSALLEMGGYLFLTLLASFLLRKLEKKAAKERRIFERYLEQERARAEKQAEREREKAEREREKADRAAEKAAEKEEPLTLKQQQ